LIDTAELTRLLRVHTPLICIEAAEELPVIAAFQSVLAGVLKPLFAWSITQGLRRLDFGEMPAQPCGGNDVLEIIRDSTQRGIYLLFDFSPHLRYMTTARHLRELAERQYGAAHTIVLIGSKLELPEELHPFVTRIELATPDADKLEAMLREEAFEWSKAHAGQRAKVSLSALKSTARSLNGLSIVQARQIARRLLSDGLLDSADAIDAIKMKFNLLNKDGVLTLELDTAAFNDVAGATRLKAWINLRKGAFLGEAKHLDAPKGVLLLGVQGCGKSLLAKAISAGFGVPLLNLDMGSAYNKYQGETERRLRDALKQAEQMSPCVLWIDEIEKGLAEGDSDGGVSRRVLGSLLTWMAERKAPVFLVATANQVDRLPPELLRKGRFDELFFVDLPNADARKAAFEVHLRKRNLSFDATEIAQLVALSEGFSGAEIEQAVVSARYKAHAENKSVHAIHVGQELHATRPLSVVMAEKVQALRDWAAARCVPAD
jgi:SpoVK/Ycf46/Vps4 family AAA+-type ATPase